MVEASSLVDGTAWLFIGGQFMPHERIMKASVCVGAFRENLVVVFCLSFIVFGFPSL